MSLLCYLKSRFTVDGVIPTMPFCTTNQRPIYNHDLVKMWSFNFHKLKSGHCSDLLATSASFKLRDEILMILKPTKLVFFFSAFRSISAHVQSSLQIFSSQCLGTCFYCCGLNRFKPDLFQSSKRQNMIGLKECTYLSTCTESQLSKRRSSVLSNVLWIVNQLYFSSKTIFRGSHKWKKFIAEIMTMIVCYICSYLTFQWDHISLNLATLAKKIKMGLHQPLFVYFHSYQTQILQKNCRRQQDSNSDRCSRRQES